MFYYIQFADGDDVLAARAENAAICDVRQLRGEEATQKFTLNGNMPDYLPNDLGWPLMSAQLREVIDSAKGVAGLLWHTAIVKSGDRCAEYYVPDFVGALDVLDRARTTFVNGPVGEMVLKPHLSLTKIGANEFFPIPGSESRLVVSNRIKVAISNMKLTGVEFSRVSCS